jgi:pyruvate dehydrogenase E1 component
MNIEYHPFVDLDPQETHEWLESLEAVQTHQGTMRTRFLLERLLERSFLIGAAPNYPATTPYINTIPVEAQPPYPGDREMERRLKGLIRWNAMAMVARANRKSKGIGGHQATFASSATLYQVGFLHFFRGAHASGGGDQIYFQGHGSPGVYSLAYLEGRLSEQHLENFRRELAAGGGLSSYPHPWLMPDFWEFPTVSMGLAPIMSIYQARFNRYLQDRGLASTENCRVWAFLGDGETDEPESLGAITLASREGLDNLTWVINCNLQRLDGPVRGNGHIIQELEAAFRGAGWNVIKVLWGTEWDPYLRQDHDGLLVRRFGEVVDGQYQKYVVENGNYIRENFFGAYPELLKMVEHLTDEEIKRLFIKRGGHDPAKVFAAYHAAVNHRGAPTVILAQTVKGYGLGAEIEGRNAAHQKKEPATAGIREMRDRYSVPVHDDKLEETPFYNPGPNSPEVKYLQERRQELGGPRPKRVVQAKPLPPLHHEPFADFDKGSGGREASTTMVFVQMLGKMLKDKEIGPLVVPIVPDEARTFGMDALFRQCGIYAAKGQLYEPVDKASLLYYKEAQDGQILEEGITEAGSMSSFIAAGSAYATHGVNTIPFFIFYSMFGFQRIGDLIWASADTRARGFLLGATAGRTTLNGEGLQHEDGHSLLMASTVPNCLAYDPAFAYEVAVIIENGIKRMYQDGESIFYYLTLYNQNYEHPPMPDGVNEGILKGIYKFKPAANPKGKLRVHLFGSGVLMQETLRAQQLLAELDVHADVWSVTSYVQLRREALDTERWNMLHPDQPARKPYLTQVLEKELWPVIAVSDYMKVLADQVGKWVPGGLVALGTDGFGRSETRSALRRFFEVDAECTALAALHHLCRKGQFPAAKVKEAMKKWNLDPEKANPAYS